MSAFSDPGRFLHSLTRLDDGVLLLIGASTLWGLIRGLAVEATGLMAWVCAIILTCRYHGLLAPFLSVHLHDTELAESISAICFFTAALIFFSIAARVLATGIRALLPLGLNHLLGAGFGVARGYLALVAIYLLAGSFFGPWTSYVMQGSRTAPYIVAGAARLAGYLPPSLRPALASPGGNGHEASL